MLKAIKKNVPSKATENDRWISIYQAMLRQRMIDEKMILLQRQGRIGFYGPITGQEAATIASAAALEEKDWIVPALREAGAAIYRGLPVEQYIAQLYGGGMDWSKGRQMPCHPTHRDRRYVSMSSCIANQLPHAVGIAMAAQYRNDPIVAMAYMGEGATSEGDFHVALNFAGVYKAPVVFFCQNNHWAISVPSSVQTASKNFAIKAEAYGFEGVHVDGNDAMAVYDVTRKAVERARRGDGPTLIEAETYRMLGHTTSDDPTRYRDAKEVASWEKKDPIVRMRKHLEKNKLWTKAKEEAFTKEVQEEIQTAVKNVEAGSKLSIESIFEDVYAEMPSHLQEQLNEALKGSSEA